MLWVEGIHCLGPWMIHGVFCSAKELKEGWRSPRKHVCILETSGLSLHLPLSNIQRPTSSTDRSQHGKLLHKIKYLTITANRSSSTTTQMSPYIYGSLLPTSPPRPPNDHSPKKGVRALPSCTLCSPQGPFWTLRWLRW